MWGHSHPPGDPCSRPCRLQNKGSPWKHPQYTPHNSPIRVVSMGFYVFLALTHRYMGSTVWAQICICSRLFRSRTVSNVLLQWARIKLSSINTLRPRQNARHFADDIFKCIFLNENVLISSKISLRFVPKGPINNIPALVQIMAWRRPGDKPLSEPMMVNLPTHICVSRPQWVNSIISVA